MTRIKFTLGLNAIPKWYAVNDIKGSNNIFFQNHTGRTYFLLSDGHVKTLLVTDTASAKVNYRNNQGTPAGPELIAAAAMAQSYLKP